MSLLQMAITPLVFITITLSITNIFRNILYINIVKKSIIYFIIVSILFVFIAILISVIENFGSIVASKKDIKEIIDANFSNIIDVNENASLNLEAHIGIKKFLQDLVPSNIFSAFANGRVEQLVIFSIFLGAAMGTISRKYTEESTYHISLEKINVSLKKIVEWILMLLPIGIFLLFQINSLLYHGK